MSAIECILPAPAGQTKQARAWLNNASSFSTNTTWRVREQRQLYLKCTSLFSRQWTMKRKVPCWELRMMNRTWKKRLVWYRPRIQVQPRMTNWATILNKINLRKKNLISFYCHGALLRHHHSKSINTSFIGCQKLSSYLVSLDWETSLFMLARVGLRLHKVAQNKVQLSWEKKTQVETDKLKGIRRNKIEKKNQDKPLLHWKTLLSKQHVSLAASSGSLSEKKELLTFPNKTKNIFLC